MLPVTIIYAAEHKNKTGLINISYEKELSSFEA